MALIVAQFASQALDVYGEGVVINKTSYVIPEDIEDPVTVQQFTCVIYEDQQTSFVQREKTNWKAACPLPREGQKREIWDLLNSETKKTYMVITSTFTDEEGTKQIHHLVNTSLYMDLYRGITEYSKILRNKKDYDDLTGLYNRGKFNEMKRTLFSRMETVAVFNMDVNNLKQMNDSCGHDAGDRLLRKAAESLKRIEARNIIPFRIGGDEFVVVAIHVNREGAEKILKEWEEGLAELNRKDSETCCEIACGFAFGEKGFDLDEVFFFFFWLMYEDKKAKKQRAGQGAGR